ncbi:hypothetical protein AB205_0157280 [Aquarana catesbeiana]|uniref:Uncharacterized protein n=1 Tax=Aquarana catesbeiana TaxID=8400 RepID=A0A2G9QEF2_AQUCT|nr:hypothetical protein AB205_0157280 [Aquarana catesbeiana]
MSVMNMSPVHTQVDISSVCVFVFVFFTDGPPVVTHYDISDTNSDTEVLNVDNMLAATVVKEHNSVSKQEPQPSWRTRGLLEELNADSGHLDPGLPSCDKLPPSETQNNEDEINIASSGSEVEIVGVQENARFVHPRGGVIQRVSSWKHAAGSQYNSSHQTPSWTGVTPQQNWTAPSEVVDLTLDEDSRCKYLLKSRALPVFVPISPLPPAQSFH